MRIGFLSTEYFGYKSTSLGIMPSRAHGGFGFVTRKKCEELAKRGYEVHAFVPASNFSRDESSSKSIEINGVSLHLYKKVSFFDQSPYKVWLGNISELLQGIKDLNKLMKDYPVDIFQSEEPGLYSLEAAKLNLPSIIVFQDPFDKKDAELMRKAAKDYTALFKTDRQNEGSLRSKIKIWRTMLGEIDKTKGNLVYELSTKRLLKIIPKSCVFAEAKFISKKVCRMFNLDYEPDVLPNPIDFPSSLPKKSDSPVVVWLARWDLQKRPYLGLQIASELPDIDFFFIGTSFGGLKIYEEGEKILKQRYSKYKNIHFKGFVADEEKGKLLDRAWILMNTSAREGLPMSFLEAGSHGLTIISNSDPDGYTSMFGRCVQTKEEFVRAIREAVHNEWHKNLGRKAYEYMQRIHATPLVMSQHEQLYRTISNKSEDLSNAISLRNRM